VHNHRNENLRILGSRVYERDYKAIVLYKLNKIFLESFLDVVVMDFLQVHGWIEYPEENFWQHPSGFFSQVSTIVHLVLIIIFPLIGGIKIWTDHESLD